MLFSKTDEVAVPKTEPTDYLTHYLPANIDIPKDLTIQFLEWAIQVDKICAISRNVQFFLTMRVRNLLIKMLAMNIGLELEGRTQIVFNDLEKSDKYRYKNIRI